MTGREIRKKIQIKITAEKRKIKQKTKKRGKIANMRLKVIFPP